MQRPVAVGLLLALVVGGCAPSGGAATTGPGAGGGASSGGGEAGAAPTTSSGDGGAGQGGLSASGGGPGASTSTGTQETGDFEAGGDRPVTVHVPPGLDAPAPLVLLLHGYASNGLLAETYFAMSDQAAAEGVILAAPDGLLDATASRYWNGTAACCDYYDTNPDDVGYLTGLIDEIASRVAVDPKRVYLVGHSAGGFMAYRAACDEASRIAAIVSLSGATEDEAADCAPSEPVSVLEIHGTADVVVPYAGGFIGVEPFPSATRTVEMWASYDGCDAVPASTPLSRDVVLPIGLDADVDSFAGCDGGAGVELWTVQGGIHQPFLAIDFGAQILAFLLAHPKP